MALQALGVLERLVVLRERYDTARCVARAALVFLAIDRMRNFRRLAAYLHRDGGAISRGSLGCGSRLMAHQTHIVSAAFMVVRNRQPSIGMTLQTSFPASYFVRDDKRLACTLRRLSGD